MIFRRYILAIISIGLLSGCDRLELDRSSKATRSNLEGIDQLQEGNIPKAQSKFMESLGEEPDQGVYQFNLGLSFERSGRGEEALKSYAQIPEEQKNVKILAYFNKARLLGEAKKIEEALTSYQQALNLKPDEELEKEIKINIELLTAQAQQNGGGEGDEEQDKQDQQNQAENEKDKDEQDKNKEKKYEQPKKQPKKFNSKELSENDVRRIFEELTQQEQKIRAEYNKDEAKETNPNGKDW